MNIKKILLTTILASSTFAAQSDQIENYCPMSRVFIDIMKNCKDIASCRNACHMLSNIIIAGATDEEYIDLINEYEPHKNCDSIDDSNIELTKAWANALIETAEYNRKIKDC